MISGFYSLYLSNCRFKKQNDTGFNVGDKLETVFEELKGLVHLIDFSSPKDDTGLFKLHSVLRSIYNGSYPIRDIINDVSSRSVCPSSTITPFFGSCKYLARIF